MSDWRDISTAPKDGTQILACWAGGGTMNVIFYSSELGPRGARWCDEGGYISDPTHWQPLPEPPVRS